MKTPTVLLLAGFATVFHTAVARGTDLRVMPVVLEPLAGAKTTTVTLTNDGAHQVKVQIRVMRWTQVDGKDVLTPTTDVVASPPMTTLKPNGQYLVRLVRVAKKPPQGEESYRVIVDELPNRAETKPGSVNLVLRQSIPVFFSDTPNRTPKLACSVISDGTELWLVGRNTGNRRIRLSDVELEANGSQVYSGPGLFGYVLPGAEMRWPVAPKLAENTKVTIKTAADIGPLEMHVAVGK